MFSVCFVLSERFVVGHGDVKTLVLSACVCKWSSQSSDLQVDYGNEAHMLLPAQSVCQGRHIANPPPPVLFSLSAPIGSGSVLSVPFPTGVVSDTTKTVTHTVCIGT